MYSILETEEFKTGEQLIDKLLSFDYYNDCKEVSRICSLNKNKCTEDIYNQYSQKFWGVELDKTSFYNMCKLENNKTVDSLNVGDFKKKKKKKNLNTKDLIDYIWDVNVRERKQGNAHNQHNKNSKNIFYETDEEKVKSECLQKEIVEKLAPLVELHNFMTKILEKK